MKAQVECRQWCHLLQFIRVWKFIKKFVIAIILFILIKEFIYPILQFFAKYIAVTQFTIVGAAMTEYFRRIVVNLRLILLASYLTTHIVCLRWTLLMRWLRLNLIQIWVTLGYQLRPCFMSLKFFALSHLNLNLFLT